MDLDTWSSGLLTTHRKINGKKKRTRIVFCIGQFVLTIITLVILEVDPFVFKDLQSHIDIVDLLQATDSWQTELG